nr:NirD/YgiW/YdeI family stress tolerance protein [Pseudodesulfovibrio sp.]
MKRMSIFLVFLMVIGLYFSTTSDLQAAGPHIVTTVAEAKASGVDAEVELSGRIVKMIQDDKFLFSDGTGELLVLIDGKMQDLNYENAKVVVSGLIAQNFMYTEVKADSIAVR